MCVCVCVCMCVRVLCCGGGGGGGDVVVVVALCETWVCLHHVVRSSLSKRLKRPTFYKDLLLLRRCFKTNISQRLE